MRFSFTLLLIVFSFSILAQDSIPSTSKFRLSAHFSPNYCYRTLEHEEEYQVIVDAREENELASFGFNTGIAMNFYFTDRFASELGIQFSRQTTASLHKELVDQFLQPIGDVYIEYRNNYIELPFTLKYHVIDKKLFSYVFMGASINILVQEKSKTWTYYPDGSKDIRTFNSLDYDSYPTTISLIGGLGLGYKISQKINFTAEPIFRRSITPLTDAPISQYNYSIGLQLGLQTKL
jgi:hypothetical protein